METITGAFVRRSLPRRDPEGHKGTFGKVLCVCGSVGYTGAPIFAGRGAVRTGSGLVFLAVPESVWPVAAVKSDEAMPFPVPEAEGRLSLLAEEPIRRRAESCDAVLIGCGLGRGWQTDALVRKLLTIEKPLVLDADGLNALSGREELLQKRAAPTILTPHEGEFLRLGGGLSAGREAAAAAFSEKYGVYLVLKGHRTVVAAPDGRLAVNGTGNSGMAKGGSGDVLAGMILSLLGQGCEAFAACCAGVWLHGRAGDLAAADKGERGMTPTDLLEQIPYAMKDL
ncbi:MAG: NAD(P)H-hydrate dehydratase [Clostridiales bacterium]|nr:NAD(P)H-hydrate dehydratase [Clostridiales bacterium]